MSSDPIEVLRAVAAFSLPEDHLLADDIEEGEYPDDQSSDYFLRYGTIRAARRALASLSAPKPDGEWVELAKELQALIDGAKGRAFTVAERAGLMIRVAALNDAARMVPKPESAEAVGDELGVLAIGVRERKDGPLVKLAFDLDEAAEWVAHTSSEYRNQNLSAPRHYYVNLVDADTAPPRPEASEGQMEALRGLIRTWREPEPDNGEEETEFDKGCEQTYRECADALETLIGTAPQQASDPVAELASRQQPLGREHGEVLAAHLDEFLDTTPQQASAPVGGSLVQTALRNLPQYISKSGLVGPDKHSAMQCFEVLRDALTQQHAAVDGAKCEATHCCPSCGRCYGCAKPAIDHLAGQQEGRSDG